MCPGRRWPATASYPPPRAPVFHSQFLRLQKPLPLLPPPNPTLSFSPPTFVFHPQPSLVQSFPSTAISISLLLSATVAISWYVRPFEHHFLHPPHLSSSQPSKGFKILFAYSRWACSWRRDLPFPALKLAWLVLRHRDKSLWFCGFSHSQIGAPSTLDSPLPQPVTSLPSFNALPFLFRTQTSPTLSHLLPHLFSSPKTPHSLPQSLPALLSHL